MRVFSGGAGVDERRVVIRDKARDQRRSQGSSVRAIEE